MFKIKLRNMHNNLSQETDNMTNDTEKIVCAVDIGTSKVAALVGKRNEFGKIEILGIGKSPSFGVQRGVVVSITKVVDSIRKAVRQAEEQSGITFQKVHVGIAGQHIKSIQNRSQINRVNTDDWITHQDVRRLKEESYKIALPPGDKILHVLQQEFIIDNEPNIQDPVGMMGVKMEGNFHIITGADSHIQNIERCVRAAGLEVASIELEPLASADAVLTKQEIEAGVALVDIGGGTTDIAIFEDFIIRHTAVIPFGGNIITEDLRDFRILKDQAERLKTEFGEAIPREELKNHTITVKGIQPGADRNLNLFSVSRVISSRMVEILAHIDHQIKISGYAKKLIGGIVLTGGGSQLKHLIQLCELETGQSTRIGKPREHLATSKIKDIDNPIYATGIGLLIRAFKIYDEERLIEAEAKKGVTEVQPKEEEPKVTLVEDTSTVPTQVEEPKPESKTEPEPKPEKPKRVLSIFSTLKRVLLEDDDQDFTDIKKNK